MKQNHPCRNCCQTTVDLLSNDYRIFVNVVDFLSTFLPIFLRIVCRFLVIFLSNCWIMVEFLSKCCRIYDEFLSKCQVIVELLSTFSFLEYWSICRVTVETLSNRCRILCRIVELLSKFLSNCLSFLELWNYCGWLCIHS